MTDAPYAYDDVPLQRFHLRVALASFGGVFSDGFGLGIIGLVLSLASPALRLTPAWQGMVGGASLLGLFLGALLTGPLADRKGRRPVYASNMLLLAVLTAGQYFVASAAQLLAFRLAIGVLLGSDYVVSKALLTEFTPRTFRGRVMSTLSIAWAAGYACAYLTGYFLMAAPGVAWRWMLFAGTVPCLLVAPLRLALPESPLWLAAHGRAAEAAEVVRRTLGPRALPPAASALEAVAAPGWQELFGRRWLRHTLVGCVLFTSQVIPYFAIGTFIPAVLQALHIREGVGGGALYNVALLAGAIGGFMVVDRMRRRTFLLGSYSLAAVALFLLAALPTLPARAVLLLFLVFALVLSAASNLVYVYLPELFPTPLRASGIGLAVASSRLGSAASTFLLPVVVADWGVRTALWCCCATLFLGGWICQRWAPETRGRRLADSVDPHAAARHE